MSAIHTVDTYPLKDLKDLKDFNIEKVKRALKKQSRLLSGIELYKEYGITKKQLHSLITEFFHFPSHYRDCLSSYHLLHWEGKYFDVRLNDGILRIKEFQNWTDAKFIDYKVVYQGCTAFQAKNAIQLRLSFRNPIPDFGLHPYVIVRILIDKDGDKE